MKILELFSKKTLTLADLQLQRTTLTSDLSEAESTATASRDSCSDVAAGLAPGSLDDAEADARAAEDRVASLRAALLKIDAAIAAETKRIGDVARAERCAAAAERVEAWKQEAQDLRAEIEPLLVKASNLIGQVNSIYGAILSPVSADVRENMGTPIAALSHTANNCDAALSFLVRGDDAAAERVLGIKR